MNGIGLLILSVRPKSLFRKPTAILLFTSGLITPLTLIWNNKMIIKSEFVRDLSIVGGLMTFIGWLAISLC